MNRNDNQWVYDMNDSLECQIVVGEAVTERSCAPRRVAHGPEKIAEHLRALRRRGRAGMTLIEIMIVVIIIGLVMSVVVVGVFPRFRRAQRATAQTAVCNAMRNLIAYKAEHSNQCPASDQERREAFGGSGTINDPWGHALTYECSEGEEVTVRSSGPNGRSGDDDDVVAPHAPECQ